MLREPWRQNLAGEACLRSRRTMGSVKTPTELTVSGMQTLHLQDRSRGSHRVKARASYVDESLFGNPAATTRPTPPDFDPPWVEKANRTSGAGTGTARAAGTNGSCETSSRGSTPTLTPRKKNKYRLISHTPSYCDESLFGFRPEGTSWEGSWMAKGDAAQLHALFWTPPATPRGSHSPRPRETPLRAIHPAGPSKTEPKVAADSRKLCPDGLDSPHPRRRERSHSLTHLNIPSTGRPPAGAPPASGPRDPRPSPSGVTSQNPLGTPRARSVHVSVPAAQRGGASQKPKPPWNMGI